ncbi:MAG: twin-arginine translocase TatA/TatE family subunit [Clostridiales bacterium]|nr:twin-arginine translocase TatA/TatE family subunit [Clostridiales bacterium]
MRIGTTELIIILAVVILIFGPSKIPQLGRALGQSIGNFKGGLKKGQQESLADEEKKEEKADN